MRCAVGTGRVEVGQVGKYAITKKRSGAKGRHRKRNLPPVSSPEAGPRASKICTKRERRLDGSDAERDAR